jgi:enoyl-CoA hydratase/carnithine racemase
MRIPKPRNLTMTEDLLHEIREGGIAWTTFNRPQARNAMTFAMYARLAELADEISADPAIRVWVIMGAGGKAFASGTDISQFREFRTAEDALNYEARIDKVLGALESCTKPVISAITGACTGGGLGIAMSCDIRIAADDATLGQPEILLGIIPGAGGTQRLARLIGPSKTKDLVFTGRFVPAAEALAMGLVDRVVPAADVYAEALKLAAKLAKGPALALRAAKEAIDRGLEVDLVTGLEIERMAFTSLFATDDRQIGMDSFVENGPGKAVFTGR